MEWTEDPLERRLGQLDAQILAGEHYLVLLRGERDRLLATKLTTKYAPNYAPTGPEAEVKVSDVT